MKLTTIFTPVLALLLAVRCGHALAAERPNVVVILVDDMGWSDIGCYGSEIPTPNLDEPAKNGVRFTQFYNTGRCSPTRASLLTGHYPHQAGMGHLEYNVKPNHPGFQGKIADSSVTMAEVLKDAGYFTAMTGKWHLGQQHGTPPWKRGFARSLNLQAGGVYFHNQTGSKGGANRAVRDGQWKLVALAGQPWELYDIDADRIELNNLASQHPDRVAAMAAQYDAWAKRTRVVTEDDSNQSTDTAKKKRKGQNGEKKKSPK